MRLSVNDEFLDQYEDTVIAQTFSVSPIGSLKDKTGGYSNRFKLPLTSKNNRILEYPSDFNSTSTNPYIKVDAQLVDVGQTIAKGYLKFLLVSNNTELLCTFYSDNSDWISAIKGKTINDLNLTAHGFTWDESGIKTIIDSDPDEGVCFPIINYGNVGTINTFTMQVEDLPPAIFVNTILSSIFNDIGWRVEGELLENQLYKRMIVPFSDVNFTRPTDPSPEVFEPFDEDLDVSGVVNLTIGGVVQQAPRS
jgi:hypothetical protein